MLGRWGYLVFILFLEISRLFSFFLEIFRIFKYADMWDPVLVSKITFY
jgi:hypothetical protein